jgi:hypothetical protein
MRKSESENESESESESERMYVWICNCAFIVSYLSKFNSIARLTNSKPKTRSSSLLGNSIVPE